MGKAGSITSMVVDGAVSTSKGAAGHGGAAAMQVTEGGGGCAQP